MPEVKVIYTSPRTQPGKIRINQVEHKTAQVLAHCDFVEEWYHDNIKQAAQVILDHPMLGNSWTYVTQYSSGNSVWRLGDKTILVDPMTKKVRF